jgi:hypothetical protein
MTRTASAELGARLCLALFCMTLAVPAGAQIVINPTRVEFDSPDHHAVLPTGEAAITYYVLEVWPRDTPAAGTPVTTLELGKPSLSAETDTVSLYVATFLLGVIPGTDFVATVLAVGPAGETRSSVSNQFVRLNGPTPTSPPVVTDPANEIVIHAGDVQSSNIHGRWDLVPVSDAAGGVALLNSNLDEPKLAAALASPVNYVEFTFTAAVGVPYHLWMRMRATSNYWGNDSVMVQFTNSVDGNNQPKYRAGTTDGARVSLEEGSGAGLSGWGWNDDAWGSVAEPIYFATNGPQVIRIQQREDGVFFDQIVLSAGRFLTTAPGTLKNDTVIVPKP